MAYDKRQAAIMFTDIQGYTKLMQQSEDLGVQVRARHREIFEPNTQNHHGRIIQYYGDGTLSIFDSCVDAVECAFQMQRLFQKDPVIPVRIGIHFGEILLTEDDIIGDSVNIASRFESLGIPGSILYSEEVYEAIRREGSLASKSLGAFKFKNDSKRRKVFALALPGVVVPKRKQLRGKLEDKNPQRRIALALLPLLLVLGGLVTLFQLGILDVKQPVDRLAVMPFESRDEDQSKAYIIDGMHEDLILRLSEAGLNVTPYTVMKKYAGTKRPVGEIAAELGVDALVEGSVSSSGDDWKIRVQLISGSDEEYLMKPFETTGALRNVQFLYRNVVRKLASAIELAFTPEAEAQLDAARAVSPEAYDFFLRARFHLNRGTSEDLEMAVDFYQQSLALDSLFGPTYSGLVETYLLQGFGGMDSREAHRQFLKYVHKATELDQNFGNDHHQLAMIKIFSEWDWVGAARELRLGIKQNPDSWELHDSYCQLMWAMGQRKESVAAGRRAVAADPEAHFARCDLAWAYFFDGQFEEAGREIEELYSRFGDECPYHAMLDIQVRLHQTQGQVAVLANLISNVENRLDRFPQDPSTTGSILGYLYVLDGQREKALGVARSMEEQGNIAAPVYLALGDTEKALDDLEKAIDQRNFLLLYIVKSHFWFDTLRDNPRFDELLKRAGLYDTHLPSALID